MNWLVPAVALWLALPLGCAEGTLLASRPAEDPSNPAAPEAPLSPSPPLSISTSPATPPPPPGEVVYTCVMHPQIIRDAPGACPLCGMTLVPIPKPAAAPPAHQHQPRGTP